MTAPQSPHILVLGAGFGGLTFCQAFRQPQARVTLVDRQNHPEAFAIGDLALVLDADGKPVPGVSPAAMQMARHIARLIGDEVLFTGRCPRRAFRYRDKGTMATIGRSAAVAKVGDVEFSGFPAWLAWLMVHLIFLIGFRNKLAVLLQWAYSYFAYKRGARIITGLIS